MAYARGLQYWAEKLNLPKGPDLHPLVGSVVELRETVQEHVTFTNWDIFQGLGVVYSGATNQWHQATIFSQVLSLLVEEQDFMEATTHTASPVVADVNILLPGMEGENWYLLVITASVEQLSLGPGGKNPEEYTADSSGGNTFQTH